MRHLILRITLVGIVLIGTLLAARAGLGQDPSKDPPKNGIIAIKPSPAWVKARIEEKERLIAAEPQVEGLPSRLSFYLRTRQPEFSILPRDNASDYTRRLSMTDRGQPSPYACVGDFDGNGMEDAAVALIDRSSNLLRLVAFHQTRAIRNPGGFEDRDYLALDIVKPGPIPSSDMLGQLLILCAPPGDYDSVGGELTLRLRNHSLFIGWYLYYFVDGIYHSLLMAD